MPARKDIVGKKFGALTVVARLQATKSGSRFRVSCECGRKCDVYLSNLRRARGCPSCAMVQVRAERRLIEGPAVYQNPEYHNWEQMRQRCNNPRMHAYRKYGGRGIRVCERWDSFATFLSDMGPRPTPVHSIDRIDPDGDYCPENCRWATPREQARNRRRHVYVTIGGVEKMLADWVSELGLHPETIKSRSEKVRITGQNHPTEQK